MHNLLYFIFDCKDHGRQQCTVQIWEKPWMNFLEVQKMECKADSSANNLEEAKEGGELPLLGTNLINRGAHRTKRQRPGKAFN